MMTACVMHCHSARTMVANDSCVDVDNYLWRKQFKYLKYIFLGAMTLPRYTEYRCLMDYSKKELQGIVCAEQLIVACGESGYC